jgi:hypothetical protein
MRPLCLMVLRAKLNNSPLPALMGKNKDCPTLQRCGNLPYLQLLDSVIRISQDSRQIKSKLLHKLRTGVLTDDLPPCPPHGGGSGRFDHVLPVIW